MTIRTLAQEDARGFTWVDLVDPTRDELAEVAERWGLHTTAVQDCLDPEHLPKFERLPGGTFLIVRAVDESASAEADSMQALTRKLAIFMGPRVLVTVHRREQPYLRAAVEQLLADLPIPNGGEGTDILLQRATVGLVAAVADTYLPLLESLETSLDGEERRVFEQGDFVGTLRRIHEQKRRAALAKRLLWHTIATVQRLSPVGDRSAPYVQDLRETVESLYAFADELLEDANSLLGIQLALASHRTNEVVRVLTLFSAVFLPLTFIVGVYGMNFDVMPELRWRLGYPTVLVFMAAIVVGIYLWFRSQGWLKR